VSNQQIHKTERPPAKATAVEKCSLLVESTGSVKSWYVLRTKPREEQLCALEMDRRGIESLCPKTREFRYRRRRQEVVPLFPGYLFAFFAFPDQYDIVRWARGVSNIVRFGENDPPSMDGTVVNFFLERMDADGIIDVSPVLQPGQKVRLLSEPLRDMVGTILRCETARGRVHILMDLLYQATVEIDDYQVQPL
jgi:transcriptional antiterminator RfaH